jgi:hypothetical protein
MRRGRPKVSNFVPRLDLFPFYDRPSVFSEFGNGPFENGV